MEKAIELLITFSIGLLGAYVSFRIFVAETKKDIEFLKERNIQQDNELKEFKSEHKATTQALNDNTIALARLQSVVENLTKIIEKKL